MNQTIPTEVDTLLKGAAIATCDLKDTTYDNGAIAIKDGKIVWLGSVSDASSIKAKETIDAKGKLLAPGLINNHCHLADSLFRGIVEDLELLDWLQVLWKAEGAILNHETNYLGARLGLAELALSGVTTVLDMFWYPETAAKASKKFGMRMYTGGQGFDLPPLDGIPKEKRVEHARGFIEEFKNDELITPLVMAHGAYTTGPESIIAMHALAQEHGLIFHIHAAETAQENQTVLDSYGERVIGHLKKLGVLGPKTLLAHAIHLNDEELATVVDSKTAIVHNPVSNLKLGSGIARIPEMIAKKVPLCVGTDGAVSGNDIDMWMAIRLAAIVHRGVREQGVAVKARQALHMATLGAAEVLGIEDKVGSLETGKLADIMMIDIRVAHAVPMFDPHAHLVLSTAKSDVDAVWVGGKAMVLDKKLVNEDLEDIVDQVNTLKPKIIESIS